MRVVNTQKIVKYIQGLFRLRVRVINQAVESAGVSLDDNMLMCRTRRGIKLLLAYQSMVETRLLTQGPENYTSTECSPRAKHVYKQVAHLLNSFRNCLAAWKDEQIH